MGRNRWQGIFVVGLIVVAAAVLPAAAGALPGPQGRITQLDVLPGNVPGDGCVSDLFASNGCEQGTGLLNAFDIAIAPDGDDVYAAGVGVASISRSAQTGKLEQTDCIGTGSCQPPFLAPLDNTRAVATSPDGEHVYAVSTQDAVVSLKRLADGTLIPLGDPVASGGIGGDRANDCIALVPGTPVSTTGCVDGRAIDAPIEIAVSPDGENVYVAGQNGAGNGAVAVFSRETSGANAGKLTQLSGTDGCVSNDGTSEEVGSPCSNPLGTQTFNDPKGIDIAGSDVYVATEAGSALHVFDRDAGSGALTHQQCIQSAGIDGCTVTGPGVSTAVDVAVAPDGEDVYVANSDGDAIAVLARDQSTGSLSQPNPVKCVSVQGSSANCGAGNDNVRSFDQPSSVYVSPDNKTVYATAANSGTIVTFSRNQSTGQPDQLSAGAGCVAESNLPPEDTCTDGNALSAASDIAVAPGGVHVYATALTSRSVTAFARQLPPTCTGGAVPGTLGAGQRTIDLECSDLNGDTLTRSILDPPDHGDLGPIDQATGTVPFTPDVGFDGGDQLRFNASDDSEPSSATTLDLDIDALAPNTQITSGPTSTVNDPTPTFGFSSSEAGSSFQCRVDGGTFASCTPPRTTAALSDGQHTFQVRARDQALNFDASPASRSFAVDTDPPETEITKGPKKKTRKKTVEFEFGADEAGSALECSLDGAAFSPCQSPMTVLAKKKGRHSFEVQATDRAGNTDQSPATHDWKRKKKKRR